MITRNIRLSLGFALTLALMLACAPSVEGLHDPPPVPPPPKPAYTETADGVRSGAQVSVIYLTSGDGAQLPSSLYDRVHAQVCEPTMDRNGEIRCMPTRYAAPLAGWFTDAACSLPLYLLDLSCPANLSTGMAYIKEATGTCAQRRLFQAVPVTGEVYTVEGGLCRTKALSLPYSTHARYQLGPEIDPSEFPKLAAAIGKP